LEEELTAQWIWQAKSHKADYHDDMGGDGFEDSQKYRLIPVLESLYPGKKMILVMDNANYHHQLNTEYYPKSMTPGAAEKCLNAHALRKAGCESIAARRPGAAGISDVDHVRKSR
jgi:hypothetical protein